MTALLVACPIVACMCYSILLVSIVSRYRTDRWSSSQWLNLYDRDPPRSTVASLVRAPVLEELVFRGILLIPAAMPFGYSAVLSGWCHLNFGYSRKWNVVRVVTMCAAGMFLEWSYRAALAAFPFASIELAHERNGSWVFNGLALFCAMALHFAHNAMVIFVAPWLRKHHRPPPATPETLAGQAP